MYEILEIAFKMHTSSGYCKEDIKVITHVTF